MTNVTIDRRRMIDFPTDHGSVELRRARFQDLEQTKRAQLYADRLREYDFGMIYDYDTATYIVVFHESSDKQVWLEFPSLDAIADPGDGRDVFNEYVAGVVRDQVHCDECGYWSSSTIYDPSNGFNYCSECVESDPELVTNIVT